MVLFLPLPVQARVNYGLWIPFGDTSVVHDAAGRLSDSPCDDHENGGQREMPVRGREHPAPPCMRRASWALCCTWSCTIMAPERCLRAFGIRRLLDWPEGKNGKNAIYSRSVVLRSKGARQRSNCYPSSSALEDNALLVRYSAVLRSARVESFNTLDTSSRMELTASKDRIGQQKREWGPRQTCRTNHVPSS